MRLVKHLVAILLILPLTADAGPPPQASKYQRPLIANARYVWGLNAPIATFAAQVHQESAFRPDARSAYAGGIAQFTPATAAWISEVYPDLADPDVFNVSWSLRALARYDLWLWDRLSGETPCERMAFVLQSYNGGLGWVKKRKRLSAQPERCLGATCEINPGVSVASQREAAHYPQAILLKHEPLYATWGRRSCS